jgi:hypothetical protein
MRLAGLLDPNSGLLVEDHIGSISGQNIAGDPSPKTGLRMTDLLDFSFGLGNWRCPALKATKKRKANGMV